MNLAYNLVRDAVSVALLAFAVWRTGLTRMVFATVMAVVAAAFFAMAGLCGNNNGTVCSLLFHIVCRGFGK